MINFNLLHFPFLCISVLIVNADNKIVWQNISTFLQIHQFIEQLAASWVLLKFFLSWNYFSTQAIITNSPFNSKFSVSIFSKPFLIQTFTSQSATTSNSPSGNPVVEPIKPVEPEKHIKNWKPVEIRFQTWILHCTKIFWLLIKFPDFSAKSHILGQKLTVPLEGKNMI